MAHTLGISVYYQESAAILIREGALVAAGSVNCLSRGTSGVFTDPAPCPLASAAPWDPGLIAAGRFSSHPDAAAPRGHGNSL